jgi:hypothetical protein
MSTPGRRVYDTDAFAPGDYGRHPADGNWYACTPGGHLGNLSAHDVVEHEDGTITASPSILISVRDSKENRVELWHGYLERGVWRSC